MELVTFSLFVLFSFSNVFFFFLNEWTIDMTVIELNEVIKAIL